jgi:hypothetical protein
MSQRHGGWIRATDGTCSGQRPWRLPQLQCRHPPDDRAGSRPHRDYGEQGTLSRTYRRGICLPASAAPLAVIGFGPSHKRCAGPARGEPATAASRVDSHDRDHRALSTRVWRRQHPQESRWRARRRRRAVAQPRRSLRRSCRHPEASAHMRQAITPAQHDPHLCEVVEVNPAVAEPCQGLLRGPPRKSS